MMLASETSSLLLATIHTASRGHEGHVCLTVALLFSRMLLLKCQHYSAAVTQLRGHSTRSISKIVAQLNADGLNGEREVSRMTDKKVRLGLPSDCQKCGAGSSLWWVSCTSRCPSW